MVSLNKDSKKERRKAGRNSAFDLGGGVDQEFHGTVPRSRSMALSSPKEFFRHYTVVFALIVTIIVFGILRPKTFLALSDVKTILTGQSALFALALTLTVALGAGEIDLSIGGGLGFSSVLIAYLSAVKGIPVPISLAISLVVMLAVAAINSYLIVKIQVNGLITTLAMGTILDGLSQAVSNSSTIGNIPSSILHIMQRRFLGIGLPFWYSVVVGIVIWYVLHHMQSGRFLYFTGEGREAARLAGIRVNRIRTISLFVSAIGAWFAGFILVGQTGAAQAGTGDPYLLPAYAATFLGAATIKPGRFNPVGTFVAVLLLAVGTTGLQLFGLTDWVTNVFDGAILIVAIGLATLVGR
ncbi:MAG: ABC transporter permease [Actinomycetota bacterium]|nr:MAG: ABC transporter permease [Actinomycetota bacterium]